jgi:hypothetical protein
MFSSPVLKSRAPAVLKSRATAVSKSRATAVLKSRATAVLKSRATARNLPSDPIRSSTRQRVTGKICDRPALRESRHLAHTSNGQPSTFTSSERRHIPGNLGLLECHELRSNVRNLTPLFLPGHHFGNDPDARRVAWMYWPRPTETVASRPRDSDCFPRSCVL